VLSNQTVDNRTVVLEVDGGRLLMGEVETRKRKVDTQRHRGGMRPSQGLTIHKGERVTRVRPEAQGTWQKLRDGPPGPEAPSSIAPCACPHGYIALRDVCNREQRAAWAHSLHLYAQLASSSSSSGEAKGLGCSNLKRSSPLASTCTRARA